jgi:phospholipase C
MDDSRRAFIKKAAMLTGGVGLLSVLPDAIQQALAIDAAPGSTYADAEHVVFLMQENRSFDHCFGALKGVRGFNDPRAIKFADQRPVWLQRNALGETFAPFRLNLLDTKSTWMSSLPHSWENQVDAFHGGKMDNWLESKKSGEKDFAKMPLTMGYYDRTDLPFYYALADAFTVCDQHFCSSLTGTSPNRLFFLSGTIRAEQNEASKAHVWNDEIDYKDLKWATFPEQLEDLGISWKAYQNELSVPVGFEGEEEDWLANFTDNDLEFFSQFNVRLHFKHLEYMEKKGVELQQRLIDLGKVLSQKPADQATLKSINEKEKQLETLKKDQKKWNKQRFEQLSERQKSLHRRAFVTNSEDPDYHTMETINYKDAGMERTMKVPKGDVLHQFRKDVDTGKLPAVSWLFAPSRFSDHPGSPWYGAWYISEVMNILTKNPETFKKTIFIVTYDENDGYFDHIPPFLPPDMTKPGTGKVSEGIDTNVEHVTLAQEKQRGFKEEDHRESAIGLGFRVPMMVISPWTKGGWVNSQVFDHTSNLLFLEHWLSKKTGKKVLQSQISDWRRTICGDLTSVFRPSPDSVRNPAPVEKLSFLQSIHKAKFKELPSAYKSFQAAEIAQVIKSPLFNPLLPQQETGIRPANALPYQLYCAGNFENGVFKYSFESKANVFGEKTAGAPFTVYFPSEINLLQETRSSVSKGNSQRSYALKAGDKLEDFISLEDFKDPHYHLQVNGPNGFFREFKGNASDPSLTVTCDYQSHQKNKLTGNVELRISQTGSSKLKEVILTDHAYGVAPMTIKLIGGLTTTILDLKNSYGWYDFSIKVKGNDAYEQRFAGRVETGSSSFSDPFMGKEKEGLSNDKLIK